jgi:hypothetical protein
LVVIEFGEERPAMAFERYHSPPSPAILGGTEMKGGRHDAS